MMCGRILKHDSEKHGKVYNFIEKVLNNITDLYTRLLDKALNHVRIILFGIGIALALNVVLFMSLPSELAPKEDRGFAIGIGIAPEGSTKEYTDKYAWNLKPIIERTPEINRYFYISKDTPM